MTDIVINEMCIFGVLFVLLKKNENELKMYSHSCLILHQKRFGEI